MSNDIGEYEYTKLEFECDDFIIRWLLDISFDSFTFRRLKK